MNIKGKHSSVFARASDRPYTYINKTTDKTRNLKSKCKFRIYETGKKALKQNYYSKITLYVCENIQIYEQVLETFRLLFLSKLTKMSKGKLSREEFFFKFVKYTHQILRLKTVVSAQKGISVDRVSKGMKQAFGKAEGLAVKTRGIKIPQPFFEIYLSKKYHLKYGSEIKRLLRKTSNKTPLTKKLITVELNPNLLKEKFTEEEINTLTKYNFFNKNYRFKTLLDNVKHLNKNVCHNLWYKAIKFIYPYY